MSLDGSGLSSSGWATFDYKTTCGSGYDTTFLGSVYDGHQYMYFITAVRLKVEQNQLVAGIEEFFLGVRCLEGL
jgi:hypothetical protein